MRQEEDMNPAQYISLEKELIEAYPVPVLLLQTNQISPEKRPEALKTLSINFQRKTIHKSLENLMVGLAMMHISGEISEQEIKELVTPICNQYLQFFRRLKIEGLPEDGEGIFNDSFADIPNMVKEHCEHDCIVSELIKMNHKDEEWPDVVLPDNLM